MNREASKGLVTEYIHRLARGDVDGALELTTSDSRFWMPGPGDLDREQIAAVFRQIGPLVERMDFSFDAWTIEGERVAVEARSDGLLKNGRTYRNRYHFLFVLRGDRIAEVREYADTAPAAVFLP